MEEIKGKEMVKKKKKVKDCSTRRENEGLRKWRMRRAKKRNRRTYFAY